MSDDEKEVEGELNPDLLEAGLDDEPALDSDILGDEDEITSVDALADAEDDEAADSDRFDDVEREDKLFE